MVGLVDELVLVDDETLEVLRVELLRTVDVDDELEATRRTSEAFVTTREVPPSEYVILEVLRSKAYSGCCF